MRNEHGKAIIQTLRNAPIDLNRYSYIQLDKSNNADDTLYNEETIPGIKLTLNSHI